MQCENCKITGQGFPHCAACKKVFYCSRDCQKSNWKIHRLVCKKTTTKKERKREKKSRLYKDIENLIRQKNWSKVYNTLMNALVKNGCRDFFNGTTHASQAAQLGDVRILKLLIDNGADATKLDDGRRTIFMYAAVGGSVEVGKFIIKKGLVDIHALDREKQNALHFAAMHGKRDFVKLLIKIGFDIHLADQFQCTAVQYAFWRGHVDAAKVLVENGADVHAVQNQYVVFQSHLHI